jgi:hypothetical protein
MKLRNKSNKFFGVNKNSIVSKISEERISEERFSFLQISKSSSFLGKVPIFEIAPLEIIENKLKEKTS